MQISKKGLIYCLAYFYGKEPQGTTNLCNLFWRFVLGSFLATILVIIFGSLVSLGFIIGFFFAARPSIFKEDHLDETPMTSYNRWLKIRGHKVFPIFFVILGLLIKSFLTLPMATILWMLEVIGVIVGVLAAIFFVFFAAVSMPKLFRMARHFLSKKTQEIPTYQLVKEYIKAKKKRVCPIVTIVDEKDES